MPGDPRACREHARRCAELAVLAATPEEQEHFLSLESTWIRFAGELESAEAFLKTMKHLRRPEQPDHWARSRGRGYVSYRQSHGSDEGSAREGRYGVHQRPAARGEDAVNFEENFVCSKTHFLYFGPPCEDGMRRAKEAEGGIGHLAEILDIR